MLWNRGPFLQRGGVRPQALWLKGFSDFAVVGLSEELCFGFKNQRQKINQNQKASKRKAPEHFSAVRKAEFEVPPLLTFSFWSFCRSLPIFKESTKLPKQGLAPYRASDVQWNKVASQPWVAEGRSSHPFLALSIEKSPEMRDGGSDQPSWNWRLRPVSIARWVSCQTPLYVICHQTDLSNQSVIAEYFPNFPSWLSCPVTLNISGANKPSRPASWPWQGEHTSLSRSTALWSEGTELDFQINLLRGLNRRSHSAQVFHNVFWMTKF